MDVLLNLGINVGYLAMQILLFSIFIILLGHFLYEPILTTLEERKERIAKGLEDARQAAIARDNADAEAKKILDAARAEAARLRQQATEQAEETAEGIVKQAQAEARQVVADAREDAREERDRVLADMRSQVVNIALAVSNKLLGETLESAQQRQLVDRFLAEPPPGLDQLAGDRAVVTSALPLTDDEKNRIRRALNVDTVEFQVDPSILGGVIVRVGDRVVDASLADQMRAMRETLA
ncbi:MAG: F0F1 ATP synthase subunit B [Candidatus Promineifilaceae bacterium]|nr:F0F1 ATP synthase subunit B [Candidatus Promineifilaceae bacterium]